MVYAQQIERKQEALEQPVLNLSLETQVFLNYHYGSRNRRKILKTLFRANVILKNQRTDKTRYLSLKAVEIANTVLHKIVNGQKVLLSHQYLSKITECDTSKQNNNIIAQLANLFDITNHSFLYRGGRVYRHHVEFKLKASVLEETKNSGALISEFHWKKISSPINNNKNISNRNIIRSSMHTHGANFSNVKNSNSQNSSTEFEETNLLVANGESINSQDNQPTTEYVETPQEPQVVETTSLKAATVTPIQTKSPRPANKRKTRTQADQKQRKAANVQTTNVVRNGFLGGGKRLSEIQPYLTDELCEKLRSKSGKLFTNKAIREITKAIAASEKGSQASFQHINGVVAYLTPALANEKRDPNKIGSASYYTVTGMTDEDKLWHQQEKYLAAVEETAIRHVNPQHQFRSKLANTLERSVAYNLLLAMQNTAEVGDMLVISLNRQIELTEQQRNVVLAQAQAVFNLEDMQGNGQAIESVEFVVSPASWQNKGSMTHPQETSQSTDRSLVTSPRLELPKGNWGKVCSAFVSEYGYDLYCYWLAGLEVNENSETNTIELRTSSGMVRDRIEQTYLLFLSKVAVECGINRIELG